MQSPFQRLQQIEQKCLESAQYMPSAEGSTDEWLGIGFRVSGHDYMAKMGEVTEILDVPSYTRVPGVKSWVIGIANVRGALLPLMDLSGFISGENMKNRNKGRVMVVNHKGVVTGLVVEEVQGIRHFSLNDQAHDLPEVNNKIKPYIKQAFKKDNSYWPVFSMFTLVEDERFLHASL